MMMTGTWLHDFNHTQHTMKYNNIFWLEDQPTFLSADERTSKDYYTPSLKSVIDEHKILLDLKSVIDKTTFAFDFVSGERIVNNNFDL